MPDYLSCGSCPVDFELADIVSFIEHKRQRCIDGSVDSDQLECIKCSKRFHTPWPLLFHIQVDHQIIIVRNLDQISLPMSVKTTVTPIIQPEQSSFMDTENVDSPRTTNHRDICTQTKKSRNSLSCCQPRPLPPCCQKIELKCFDEPCLCPSVSDVICTSKTCYINQDNPKTTSSDNNVSICFVCPQGSSLKKESREVQTDFEYNDDVDINFLLSNSSDSFSQQANQQYGDTYPLGVEKNWEYVPQMVGSITDHSNSNYLANYESQNYQILLPTARQYALPDENMMIETNPPSLTSSPIGFNPTSLFQESNHSFHYGESRPRPFVPSASEISVDCNTENIDRAAECDRKEFRFLCPNCGKRFRQKVHLRKHVMSQHARQKPHKCSQCGYTTVEKSHLTVHIRTHTGERPYTCRRCSYSSAQNCTLKSHYLRRHPGDQIECTLCGSYFITEQERNNHQRSCRMVNGGHGEADVGAHVDPQKLA